MFDLDLRSRKPIYEQLVDKLKALIINEVLQQDEKLPSVRTLAQQITVNPNTIQKAYRELETQGFIYSIKGKGSFVSPTAISENKEELTKMKESLKQLIAEALFLGIKADAIHALVDEATDVVNRRNEK
ncbi:GntR family transcriptional regulator [Aquibacillus sp. 3ASR75-11]|uniref:GntR family transcriptional regulator n=1 Tax=Terrihalobacillus insolitus TaxID=2950438 RepID=A0A9X4AN56_9BACI|nr:GntR family transcriptional regulator [Terrihalobacillus insolitus]MDC3414524.1 GntR family transcriptional regulator [Terrihalobacillus insolitus]MDC3426142.1 GntR family transcriptional regulator [Terrihalobacillus insolitus]